MMIEYWVTGIESLRSTGLTRYAQNFVCKRDRYGPGLMVWAGIMHIEEHRFTSFSKEALHRNCIADIILDNVRIYRGAVGPDFQFMEVNARPHRSVEDDLCRRVAQRTIPSRKKQEFKTALGLEGDIIPQVKSIENRCKMRISVHSQHTSY
ncbi:hypothetical protein TNCV_882541 [Trichonephila clavipes]|nr:hypothetical protein TNCV_882541 [Trichonephila clavipes]